MDTNNIQIVPIEQEEKESSNFSFKSLIGRYIKNWYWFVISAVFCLGVASLYILRTRPTYTRSATVLIKEAAARRMATSDIESVLSFSGGSMSSKVVNEVIAFESPALMQEVVKRLDLTTEYYSPSLFRDNVIYKAQVPVEISFIDVPDNIGLTFRISHLKDSTKFEISDFEYRIKKDKFKISSIIGAIGDTLRTDIGSISVNRSDLFIGEWKKPVIVKRYSLDAATAMYSARLKSEPTDMKNKSDVLNIVLSDYSVQRADDILNMLINVYNESWVEDKNKMAVSTSNFITERLIALEKELGDVDNNISNYKSENLLPDLSAASELYMSQTKEYAKMQQDLTAQLNVFKYVKTYLAANPGTETLIPVSTSISSNAIASQISEYNKTLLNRNNIRSNSSEKNPLVKDLTAALESTRTAIETAIENQIGTITEQINDLSGFEKSNNRRIAQSPTQAKYLLSVGRQQKVKESLYLYLLQKREENELSQAFTAYNTRIITPPMGAARKSSPKSAQIILIALFLGLFAPLAVCYIIEATDTKVKTRSDLKDLTLPYLGEVPFYESETKKWARVLHKKDESGSASVIVRPGVRNVVNEALRVIRTNLEFMERGSKCPVIISCSFNPGSGKTFLTANISAALAIKGKKVLAIDGDLRRASLSEYVGSPRKGLSDYLAEPSGNINDYIVPNEEISGLHFLPVGTIPPNPSELISQDIFKKTIESLKKDYDYIFIDCPPVDIVADAQIIEECSDRTIFIIRAGVMDRKDIASLQSQYDKKRFKNLCYIFNGVESTSSYYGHYGNYGGYYGYGKKKNTYYTK